VTSQRHIQEEFSRQAGSMATSRRFNNEEALARLRNILEPAPAIHVLELACGPGIVAAYLGPHVGSIVGLDLTPVMLERAVRTVASAGQNNAVFVLGDCESLPFAAGSFEAVTTRSAVHHFHHPEAVLSEVKRVLKPGGKLVISDVVSSEDRDDASLHNALETLRDPTHVRMLAESELLAILRNSGFELEAMESTVAIREFEEWLAITSAPERAGPLRTVMTAFAEGGMHAGVNLRVEDGRVLFEHRTLVLRARRL
jgi:ubiquinone/menaquinone biosynthesis C-methylase UbiE